MYDSVFVISMSGGNYVIDWFKCRVKCRVVNTSIYDRHGYFSSPWEPWLWSGAGTECA